MTVTAGGTNSCTTLPGIPAGFTAAENSNNQIALNWTPSTVPATCHVGYYNLYRGTKAGFTPSEANEIATVVDTNTYVDTTAVCGTPYFYFVEGLDLAGSSLSSVSATASISQCPTTSSAQINAGGTEVAPYLADVDFTGGSASKNTAAIDLTGVTNPAPAAVYGTARQGNFTYTLHGFTPNSTHTLRLQFVEPYFTSAGSRTFNISVNGAVVMTNYDIFSAAGGKKNKAVVYARTVAADETGAISVQFTSVKDSSLVNAVEVK